MGVKTHHQNLADWRLEFLTNGVTTAAGTMSKKKKEPCRLVLEKRKENGQSHERSLVKVGNGK